MTTRSDPPRAGWREVLVRLTRPRVAVMLGLGLASGLPFMLVGNTMGYWLREVDVELSAIGFLSWVGLAYSLKFLWAPLIDRVRAPLLGRWLGRRRGWIALAQIGVIGALVGMGLVGPQAGLWLFGALALLAAFASATQDIVVDAWRIESAESSEDLGLLTAAYQLGYRAALLITDALILIVAAGVGWALSYELMGLAVGIGLVATWFAQEPRAAAQAGMPRRPSLAGARDAVLGPFSAFFRQHGRWAVAMLAVIGLYRLPDFVMGPMANPLYADLGLAKELVGSIRGSAGLIATTAGIAAAGLAAIRFGFTTTLLFGAIVGPGSNICYAWLAWSGPDMAVFTTAMVVDNFANGFAGTALVAYMSSLTNVGYTATQYALLSSFYAFLGKLTKGLSGVAVEALETGRNLLDAYALFFLGTALIGLPAFLLCLVLVRRRPPAIAATPPPS